MKRVIGRLLPVLRAALRVVCAEKPSGQSPGAGWQGEEGTLTGWLNVSERSGWNALHDHGESVWSLVYFVQNGKCEEGEEEAFSSDGPEGGGASAGSLLLRTQLKPYSHQYAWLEAPPIPGTLWVFPGYLSHAVLPRAFQPQAQAEDRAAKAEPAGGTKAPARWRISVACNSTG